MKNQNLVLYRKYRPRTFSEVVGQEYIVKTLTNAISENMISHAYLFAGPRGTGKTTIARLLAKSLNCLNRKEKEFEPCNDCSSCKEIDEGIAIDLVEIDAASHRGIDEIRELRDGIRFSPTKSKYKIFIIDECHQLSRDAANALLKTLEEPPSHAVFILATTEAHKMIPTIVSRCQRFDFRRLTASEIIDKLEAVSQKENIKIDRQSLSLIAMNSEGSIRDAEGFLDQVITFAGEKKEIRPEDVRNLLGMVEINLIGEFVDFFVKQDSRGAVDFLNTMLDKGYDPYEFSKALIDYLRNALLLKLSSSLRDSVLEGLTKEEKERLLKQVGYFKESYLKDLLNIFLEAATKMKYSPIPQLPLELGIVEAINLRK